MTPKDYEPGNKVPAPRDRLHPPTSSTTCDTAIVEEDINGTVLAWNGFGADGLRTRYTASPNGGASQTQHYAFDPTGNLSNRLDPNGQASNTTVFDAFGALRGQINTATGQPEVNLDPVGFSGQWGGYTDPETKLVLLTHRYYDPSHGEVAEQGSDWVRGWAEPVRVLWE